jgi:hypothetical protein
LTAGLVILLLFVLGGIFIAKTVRVRSTRGVNGQDVAIETPAGRLNIRARENMNPDIGGVPVYPGAARTNDSGGASFEWSSSDGATDKNLYVVGAEFRTPDSPEKVVEFYRAQLPSVMIVNERHGSTHLEYKDGGIQRIIAIREQDGETRIAVASVGGRASN